MSNVNEYKSDLFSMLLEEQEYALAVYNALNGSDYQDPSMIKIERLPAGYSLSIRNDASFFIDHEFNLYEHQSTWCPNMPLRMLMYYMDEVNRINKDKNLTGKGIVTIPKPQFVVFYNGKEKRPEYEEMRLSDAFEKQDDRLSLEAVVHVYNINPGYNETLVQGCNVLHSYQTIVSNISERIEDGMDTREAIIATLDHCVENGILSEYIQENREDLLEMLTFDYSIERRIELEKRDSLQEGLQEGRQEGEAIGLQRGQDLLSRAVQAINSGADTQDKLLAQGFDESTAKKAISLYNTLYDTIKNS